MFITAFTGARYLSLSWLTSIQSMPLHPTTWRSILILSFHLRLVLPSGSLFPTGLSTKTLYTTHLSPMRVTCTAHLIILDLITKKIFVRSTEYNAPRFVVFSILIINHSKIHCVAVWAVYTASHSGLLTVSLPILGSCYCAGYEHIRDTQLYGEEA